MKSQRLRDARKKLDTVRQEMVRAITNVLPTASDQQLTRVALVFWPEPKSPKGKSGPKTKPKSPKGKSGPKAQLRRISTRATRKLVSSVTPTSTKNAAEGRRQVACGLRPPLKEAMVLVLSEGVLNAEAMVEALDKKKWLPASSDHRQYISFMFSNNCPETFERAGKRGFYKVAEGVLQKARAEAKRRERVDKELKDHWGVNTDVAADPYEAADNGKAAGNGKAITTDIVWKAIQLAALSKVTLPELAKHLKCDVNQLGSPLTKLRRKGKLIRGSGKDGVVYEVRQEGDGETGS